MGSPVTKLTTPLPTGGTAGRGGRCGVLVAPIVPRIEPGSVTAVRMPEGRLPLFDCLVTRGLLDALNVLDFVRREPHPASRFDRAYWVAQLVVPPNLFEKQIMRRTRRQTDP